MKRVAVFLPSLRGGGAERAMLLFGAGALLQGFEIDLVLVNSKGPLRDIVPSGMRIVDFGKRRAVMSLLPLTSYLWQTKPSAVFSTVIHTNIIALIAGKIAGVPIIARESNVPVTEPKRTLSRKIVFLLSKIVYPWAHRIIAVSSGVADELRALGDRVARKVVVMRTPVISDHIIAQGDEKLEHPWFAVGEPPVILAVGRLTAQKDFPTLLRAFAEVVKSREARLIILGEGGDRGELEELARQLGVRDRVELQGFVINPFPYMKAANTFVLSSIFEGMPNVLIQAMAFGTPVVSTDCKSGPAEVLLGGRYGTLVPIGDYYAMAKAILDALQKAKQVETISYVKEQFGMESSAREYLSLIPSV